jgi:hypothetical protein
MFAQPSPIVDIGSRPPYSPVARRRRCAICVTPNVGIGEHRLGGFDVVVREFRWADSGAANTPRDGKARLGADQTALGFSLMRCTA